MKSDTKKSKHGKLILILMIGIVFAPFLFAWRLVHTGNSENLKLNNHGELIIPPSRFTQLPLMNLANQQPMSSDELLGKWWILYVGPSKCYQECQTILYNMRQIKVALGKNSNRVERVFIPHPKCPQNVCEQYLNEFYPDMLRVQLQTQPFEALFREHSALKHNEMIGNLFILDPQGNIMMHYSPEQHPKDILTDLKKLLRASKIG